MNNLHPFRRPFLSFLLFVLTVARRLVPCDTFSLLLLLPPPPPPQQQSARPSSSDSFQSLLWSGQPIVGQQHVQNAQRRKRASLVSLALPSKTLDRADASSDISPHMITATATTRNRHHSLPIPTACRRILSRALLAGSFCFSVLMLPAVEPATAGLLDEYGADPTKIVQPSSSSSVPLVTKKKGEQGIDPTLRASYYYPTARKRYLPRILKVSREMVSVSETLSNQDWESIQTNFLPMAENAILPLQLYVSSLDGQGLSMTNSYAKQMKADALAYENAFRRLQKAVGNQNRDAAFLALTDMAEAINDYRQQGRLTNDEDGEFPSIDEMRRMAMRQPTIKIQAR